MTRGGLGLAFVFVALTALGEKPCDSGKILAHPALRELPRARVIRTVCDVREDKESQRTISIAWIVSYETGVAAEVRFTGGEVLDVRRLAGQPQSSEEERAEAEAIIRKGVRPDVRFVVDGGFVVPPPEGAPPGRYVEMHALTPDRKRLVIEFIVDLTRGKIAAERVAQ